MLINKLEKNRPFIISGPCSAESEQQVLRTANAIKSIVDVFGQVFGNLELNQIILKG